MNVVIVLLIIAGAVFYFWKKNQKPEVRPDPVSPPVVVKPPEVPVVVPPVVVVTPPVETKPPVEVPPVVVVTPIEPPVSFRESDFSSPSGPNLWETRTAWRVGFSGPGSKSLRYTVTAERPGTVLVIDNPNGDVSVSIGLVGAKGDPVQNGRSVPSIPGMYEIVATAADTPWVQEHGARANIQFSIGA